MRIEGAAPKSARAARGALFITGAKVYFVLTGFVVQFALPHLLGDAATFGVYATAMTLGSILNNVLVAATIQTVAKFTSEVDPDQGWRPVLRAALGYQLVLGTVLAAGLALAAGPFASGFLHKPALATALRIPAVVVFAYALYAAVVGSLNGRRLFGRQATLDVTFSTLRTAGILGLAAVASAVGALWGLAVAAVLVLAIAIGWVGMGRPGGPAPGPGAYFRFALPVLAYHLAINLIMQADVLLLSRAVSESWAASGASALEATREANALVGYYRTSQGFALIPYQLTMAAGFVSFPLVAKAIAEQDRGQLREIVRTTLRFGLLALLLLAVPLSSRPEGVLAFVYTADYAQGAASLAILPAAFVAFTVFTICCTLLNALGLARMTAILAVVALAGVVGMNFLLVPGTVGSEALRATALATATGMTIGCAGAVAVLWREVGVPVPAATVLRALAASALGILVGRLFPGSGRAATLIACAAACGAYGALLVLTREVGGAELAHIKAALGLRPRG